MTSIPIKGEVQGIERSPGRTDVLVDEGLATATYTLDEALIDFQSALEELVSMGQGGGFRVTCLLLCVPDVGGGPLHMRSQACVVCRTHVAIVSWPILARACLPRPAPVPSLYTSSVCGYM